ncbi:dihydroxyacetone kinase subunit DhaL [Streptomyces evansiae]|uniref:dihydroxyacetone kinase subunit DhaL n=1 Tax=Streptomyces evansiae TaxID=3075535 RepID=UPI0028882A95|nr:dihydroxyacetone kinase subunit DhaL [Streptomyces sp. DSM 41859]MDT0425262.1 dihydroxyacetone kinase subunit DhaL [Streptomyces sp. DSM 41859]
MGDEGRDKGGTGGPGTLDAAFFRRWLDSAAALIDEEAERLTALDSAIGDADHGANMRRGFSAVRESLAAEEPASPQAVLALAGRRLVSTVGGASGPLYGTLLRRTGKALGEALGERTDPDRTEFAAALRAGIDAVSALGGAKPGDKTMIDALVPAAEALSTSWEAAAEAAREGAAATVPMRAHKGRASYLGERSEGHEDPGAASAALLLGALADTAGRAGA